MEEATAIKVGENLTCWSWSENSNSIILTRINYFYPLRSRTLVVQVALSTLIWWIRTPPRLTRLGLRKAPRTASSSNRRQGAWETCLTGLQYRRERHELHSGCIEVQMQLNNDSFHALLSTRVPFFFCFYARVKMNVVTVWQQILVYCIFILYIWWIPLQDFVLLRPL